MQKIISVLSLATIVIGLITCVLVWSDNQDKKREIFVLNYTLCMTEKYPNAMIRVEYMGEECVN